jgi:general secretion pathway protein E
MDIAERRTPQDGRFVVKVGGRRIDLRVSTLPTQYGEKVVMRLLESEAATKDFAGLGIPSEIASGLSDILRMPQGLLLVTGPTGSGKSTTLYSCLQTIRRPAVNIVTVEDPIEYTLPGLNQVQVNTKAGLTFAGSLRSVLRQDPDVVMVGEIRDVETAEIAIKAAQTGHLVLSTLHTNTAAGALTRLRDMGIEPFLLSSSLVGVLAQRLVRVLNPETRQAFTAGEYERRLLALKPDDPSPTLYRPGRDPGGGYRGRTGIYELILIDDTLRTMIHDGVGEHDLERYARKFTPSIRDDGLSRVLKGETTIEEVLRVTRED